MGTFYIYETCVTKPDYESIVKFNMAAPLSGIVSTVHLNFRFSFHSWLLLLLLLLFVGSNECLQSVGEELQLILKAGQLVHQHHVFFVHAGAI